MHLYTIEQLNAIRADSRVNEHIRDWAYYFAMGDDTTACNAELGVCDALIGTLGDDNISVDAYELVFVNRTSSADVARVQFTNGQSVDIDILR